MNKDQKLLEEAYQSIYESVAREPAYFGPEKDKKAWFNWLKKVEYQVHEDGSVSVIGNVETRPKTSIERLPFNFKDVKGDFDCYSYGLTSLEGAPSFVEGNFGCFFNNITSLKGAPEHVGRDFMCNYNKRLVSLEGAPTFVGRDCILFDNFNLISLEGAPTFVGRHFHCLMSNVASLKGAPKEIKGDFRTDKFSDEDYRKYTKRIEDVNKELSDTFSEEDLKALEDF